MDADTIQNKRELQYVHQCAHHASVEKWVVFTDLHCSPSSLDTCLAILDKVHHEALERNAGVLFLGDFWHHRATIRIDVLNAVLESLREWQVPMILIPGNHDQVTLGGHSHGLTPLENAYRVEYQDCDEKTQSVPGPLIFTHPTKFQNALFVPHIRNGTIMECVLRSESALNSTALFVHADVTGAYMNDLIVSQGGVSPSWFPPSTLIYSGHFHKPHQVTSGNVCIEYIGSPYETSLAEAGQQKSLVVLNARTNWSCVERIPLCIGRKHFSAASLEELLALNVVGGNCIGAIKSGDRVVVTIQKDELEEMRRAGDVRFDNQTKSIRQLGAVVEVREIPSQAVGPLKPMFEELTPQTTLSAYFQEQVRREAITKTTAEQLLKAGLLLLEDLEVEQESTMTNPSGTMTDLTLESVTLQGFGPFKDKVSYPLNNRGLVLVRGINKDGGADR
jgi:DNA repair exonuclease SbcCD nuclease subunit